MGHLKLRKYQERAIQFWLEKKKVYFAIDMGLGKTAIVLHTLNQLAQPALIVAPLKVTYNTWPDEIAVWNLQGEIQVEILHGPEKDKAYRTQAQIHAINYEGIPWLYKRLYDDFKKGKKLPYRILVLDEATYIKDSRSNRFKYLCAMQDMFEYIALLSGTPAPNSLMDLWSQYFIIDKGGSLGSNFTLFKKRFFKQDTYRKFRWTIRFGAENAIHKAIAPSTFRLSSDDYISLPPRVFNSVNLELSHGQRKQYESFKKDFILLMEEAEIKSFNKASLSSKLRQFVQGFIYENCDDGTRKAHFIHDIKISALKHAFQALSGKSVLCLIQFQFEIEMIQKAFPGAPFITGATSNAIGNSLIRQWNQGKVPLLIAHPRSIGRGLNLQKGGHNIIWFALPWSLDDYLQLNKRLHRPGQKETVVIQHLVIKNTIDELVFKALHFKEATQDKLLEFLRQNTRRIKV